MLWLARLVGAQRAPAVALTLALFALVVVVGLVARAFTPRDTTAQRQAEQTSRSGDAIANAASAAVETISNRAVTEMDIDRATVRATEDIANASDIDAVRSAVLDSVCSQAAHRNDPACAMR